MNNHINNFISLLLLNTKQYLVILFLLVIANQSFAEVIVVGGEMIDNETWTGDNIYEVQQDLLISNGVVLTIEPGVLVRVNYNRGIIIDNGSINVLGVEGDSVNFIPNYNFPGEVWKWIGIVIKNCNSGVVINYANITDAETAVLIEGSYNVKIKNSSLLNCQNGFGIQIVNSSWCTLSNCDIENNYIGIEMLAGFQESTSNNKISNCIIKNQNHNIKVQSDANGITRNNLISENLVGEGNNGIWIVNSGNNAFSGNIISNNIIINNGSEVGYGLFLAHDSTIVSNNIFWKNHIALFSGEDGDNCSIYNNSFFRNTSAITLGGGSVGNKFSHNTFSLNSGRVFTIRETSFIKFMQNNLLNNTGQDIIVVNNTEFDLPIANNYWGTIDTSSISLMIYDKLDNEGLGELNYKPFLNTVDTTNPVCPPIKVVKQIDGNKLRISWRANKEEDLKGYAIYSGIYDDYGFSQKHQIGLDTSFILSDNISLYDSVAVTAFDSNDTTINLQLTGHESPFEFAVFHPYAGGDAIICRDENKFKISNSNIPFEYENLIWTTDGDGYFSGSDILHPDYFPGFVDFISGEVQLSLEVNASEDVYYDNFTLSIRKNPIAFAGNDTIVFPDMSLSLVNAIAYNYDSVKWVSSGDGTFNMENVINPIYTPGINDIETGEVFLEITAYSYCQPAIDTIKVIVETYFSVEGQLWSTQKYNEPGVVIAYKNIEDGPRAVNIANAETDGSFKFEKLVTGDYYFYAVPDTNNFENVVPGYYADKFNWESAYLLNVDADVYDVDINFLTTDYVLPIGQASISGHMSLPSDKKYNSSIYCTPWIGYSESAYCEDGLSNVTIFLYNNDKSKLLDFALTDNGGNFYFNDLPFGLYVVVAEKAGFVSIASSLIELSAENNHESDVVLEITDQKLAFTINNNIIEQHSFKVYPNPAKNQLYISYPNPFSLSSEIEVYDLFGNCVLKNSIQSREAYVNYKLDITDLSSGLYFVQKINSNEALQLRFVKK